MKKIISVILVIALACALGITAFAAGTVTVSSASYDAGKKELSVSGTTSGVKAAVIVQVVDGSSNILAMESFIVSNNAFDGKISGLALENGKTYTAKAADFDGGVWASKDFKLTLTGTAAITGTAKSGQTLTASFTGNKVDGETLSYQWKRGATNIGTNAATYTLTADDIGSTITVTVSGSKHDGTVVSAATAEIERADSGDTPPVTPPDSDDDGKVETDTVTAEVHDGTVTVSEINIEEYDEDEQISLDFSNIGSDVNEVELPSEAVSAISEATSEGVEIKLTDAEIKLDAETLETIAEALGDEALSLSVKVGEEALKELTEEQSAVVGDMENVIVISASITAGDEKISDFGGGTVKLTVDYPWDGEGILRAAFIKDDGTVEVVPVTFVNGKATISVKHFSSYVIYTEEALPFTDVTNPTSFYYDAVKWAVGEKITKGTDDTHFSPLETCTRAQMVTFMWRAAGCPEPTSKTCRFTDVKENAFYYNAVLWAVENGITKGTSDTTFSPDDTVSRGQVVTFLYRLNGSEAVSAENTFTDIKSGAYYYDAVLWAIENDITKGTSTTTFSPDADCTRAQIVTFLYRNFVK